jgi:hypothetical protein
MGASFSKQKGQVATGCTKGLVGSQRRGITAVDKLLFWMDITPMLRKALALLLVFSWVILSGFDLLEDFDFPIQVGVHSPLEDSVPKVGHGVDLVNNILESGDRTRLYHADLFELPIVHLSADAPLVSKKVFRIHKLHCVFLI